MPTHGHDFGIDTDHQLRPNNPPGFVNGLDWGAIQGQRANPVFAGRYFNPGVRPTWVNGETAGVKQANPALAYIYPMQSPGQAPFNRVQGLRADGTKEDSDVVQSWGDTDAKATCSRIWQVVKNNELQFPSPQKVIVYLDVEPGINLSSDYWYGWASRVYWFGTDFFRWPFYPGLYCTTSHNPADPSRNWRLHRIPSGARTLSNAIAATGSQPATPSSMRGIVVGTTMFVDYCTSSQETVVVTAVTPATFTANFTKTHAAGATLSLGEVQTGLTASPNNLASRCYGIYASNPQDDNSGFSPPGPQGANARFQPNFFPDWGTAPDVRFDVWRQTVHVIFGLIAWHTDVEVLLWQYAAQPGGAAFDALHVDLDETSPPNGEAINWMLKLP